ncbi:MAG: transposase [Firmicutes bacterium]|nr:transposase [Bacillota bacterium]
MPRSARKDLDGKYYHVMVQGIGKEFVFPNDHYKGFYLACLKENKVHYPAKLLAFCVMGNHAHILLSVSGAQELALYFKRVNGDYARYYNRMNGRVGYVFRDRFKSEVIRSERQLVYCMAYIQNNPLKAKIVERAEDYLFSSYSNYLRGTGIVDFDEAACFYDIAPDNIAAIMAERTDGVWLEHEDSFENAREIAVEVLEKFRINVQPNIRAVDKDRIFAAIVEIKKRTRASLREISDLTGIGRETLRKLMSDKSCQGDGGI